MGPCPEGPAREKGKIEGNQNPKQGGSRLLRSPEPQAPNGSCWRPGWRRERTPPAPRGPDGPPETGVPSALLPNRVFDVCPLSLLGPASPRAPNPAPSRGGPGRLFPRTWGGRARAGQACSRRPLNASSPKTPRSKRSSSRALPRIGKRGPAASSSSRGSIPAPPVRPGAERRLRAGHPPPGLRASGET